MSMSLPNKSLFLTRGQASNLFQKKNQLVQYIFQITEPGGTFNANFARKRENLMKPNEMTVPSS